LPCIDSFACEASKCVAQAKASGAAPKSDLQTPHDCNRVVCDGEGGTELVPDNADAPPAAENVCVILSCDDGQIKVAPAVPADNNPIPCGAGSKGKCTAGACILDQASCDDGVKNGDEADVDCGAKCEGKKCADGKYCAGAEDCSSGVCGVEGVCLPDHCKNGVDNPFLGETAKDCGGPCDKCESGKGCKKPSDCVSNKCKWFLVNYCE
jgi:hypothetical protein